MLLLFHPLNPSQARREFGAVFFMMCYTLAALSVPRTSFLRARAFYVIMWTGHIIKIYTSEAIFVLEFIQAIKKDTSYAMLLLCGQGIVALFSYNYA